MFLFILSLHFNVQVQKQWYLAILKSSSNLIKHKILLRDVLKKEKNINGKRLSWIRNLSFDFRKVNKLLVIFKCSLQHNIKFFFEGVSETSLSKFEELSTIGVLFFKTSFLVTLATTFSLQGFASSSFHFCVQIFFLVASISFNMFVIVWLSISKLGVPSLHLVEECET
jgi:hypothetical protein